MFNFQQYRHIQAPGWTLGWTWAKKEVIWSMMGSQTTDQGDCSRFKGNIPHCCKKNPTVVDLLPGTPYNQQIANCCKGGVISSWVQDPVNAVSAFQVSVGAAGTSNKTVRLPKNFTLMAPGPGYTCGPAKIVRSTKYITPDKRRVTQALSKLLAPARQINSVIVISLYANCYVFKLEVTVINIFYGTWVPGGLLANQCDGLSLFGEVAAKYFIVLTTFSYIFTVTWNVTCTYSQFLAQKTPSCCVSLSSFYNDTIVNCPTCTCGCKNNVTDPGTCIEWVL